MKIIEYLISKEDSTSSPTKYRVEIGDDLFGVLNAHIPYVQENKYKNLFNTKILGQFESLTGELTEYQYDIYYSILKTQLGVSSNEIDMLEVFDYEDTKIIVEVFLMEK